MNATKANNLPNSEAPVWNLIVVWFKLQTFSLLSISKRRLKM